MRRGDCPLPAPSPARITGGFDARGECGRPLGGAGQPHPRQGAHQDVSGPDAQGHGVSVDGDGRARAHRRGRAPRVLRGRGHARDDRHAVLARELARGPRERAGLPRDVRAQERRAPARGAHRPVRPLGLSPAHRERPRRPRLHPSDAAPRPARSTTPASTASAEDAMAPLWLWAFAGGSRAAPSARRSTPTRSGMHTFIDGAVRSGGHHLPSMFRFGLRHPCTRACVPWTSA